MSCRNHIFYKFITFFNIWRRYSNIVLKPYHEWTFQYVVTEYLLKKCKWNHKKNRGTWNKHLNSRYQYNLIEMNKFQNKPSTRRLKCSRWSFEHGRKTDIDRLAVRVYSTYWTNAYERSCSPSTQANIDSHNVCSPCATHSVRSCTHL